MQPRYFHLLALASLAFGQRPLVPNLPNPRIVIVGATGSGKSSLANAFLGCDPQSDECLFKVCSNQDSCTKETTYGFGPWLGTGQNFTVVDTPGFGDSDNDDEVLIEEMMDTLANVVDHVDTIVLLLDGRKTRFDASLQNMLNRMSQIFGLDWWNYVVIGVSFWAYDQHSIDERECYPDYPERCHDEAWFCGETNLQLQEKFNLDLNFTCVFTDSWSQTAGPPGFNTDDPLQQEHWNTETDILWDITASREDTFGFLTIEDILEENTRLKEENRQLKEENSFLNGVIHDNITHLTEMIQTNSQNIAENVDNLDILEGQVADNGDNLGILEGRVAVNGGNIVSTNRRIDENKAYINKNTANIDENKGDISTNQAKINQNGNDIASNKEDITRNGNKIASNKEGITSNNNDIARQSTRGAQCGYKNSWSYSYSKITYDSLLLDTGRGSLDISSGKWTAEETGLYEVNWSLYNRLDNNGKGNQINLYKNGAVLPESLHRSTYQGYYDIREQGGRSMLLTLKKGNTLHLQTSTFDGFAYYIQFCVHLLSVD